MKIQSIAAIMALVGMQILLGAGVGVWGLVDWIQHGSPPGLALLGAAVLFLLGLHGLLMAIVGEQLGRIQRLLERGSWYTIEREL